MYSPCGETVNQLIAWLDDMSRRGGKGTVNNVDARALGRVAEAMSALRDYAEYLLRRAA